MPSRRSLDGRRGREAWGTPLREFLRTETGGAAVLLAAAVAALIWMNVDSSSYESFWGTTWTANTFALLGLGAPLALVDILVRRFR